MQSAPTSIIGLPAQNFQSIFGKGKRRPWGPPPVTKTLEKVQNPPCKAGRKGNGVDDKGDQQLALLAPFGETLNIIPGCCAGFMADVPEW